MRYLATGWVASKIHEKYPRYAYVLADGNVSYKELMCASDAKNTRRYMKRRGMLWLMVWITLMEGIFGMECLQISKKVKGIIGIKLGSALFHLSTIFLGLYLPLYERSKGHLIHMTICMIQLLLMGILFFGKLMSNT